MRTRSGLVVIALALTAAIGLLGSKGATAGSSTGRPRYLATGDSITVGRRASDPATTGYVPLLAANLAPLLGPGNAGPMPEAADGNYFGVANIGRLGDETTGDMIAEGQLEEALAILRHHNQNGSPRDDVELVTLTIGGNDMRALLADPRCAPVPGPNCMAAV